MDPRGSHSCCSSVNCALPCFHPHRKPARQCRQPTRGRRVLSLLAAECFSPLCPLNPSLLLFQTPCHSWMWLRPTRSSWSRARSCTTHWWTATGSPWTQCLQRSPPWCSQDKAQARVGFVRELRDSCFKKRLLQELLPFLKFVRF